MTVSSDYKEGHVMLFETLYNYRMKQENRNQKSPETWMDEEKEDI